MTEFRRAVRVLRRSPGFTAAAVLTLALGIAANTAVFSVLRSVLLRPLPYAESGVVLAMERDSSGNNRLASYPTFTDWRAGTDAFEAMAFVRGSGSLLKGPAGAERLLTAYVSDDFFRVLREPALIGRALIADDMRPDAPAVAVLSEQLWRRRFGGDRAVVGRPI
jgi:putative ABC transport system permease protein